MTTTTFYGMEIASDVVRKANEDNSWESHYPVAATSFDSTRNSFDIEYLCQASNLYLWWKPNVGCHHEHSYIMRADSRAAKGGQWCQYCSMASKSELEGTVFEFIRSITPKEVDVLVSMRILPKGIKGVGGTEIDIYLPQLRLGFEVNGPNHGAVKYYPKGYHEAKVIMAESIGIDLHHIWYKDMRDKKDETFSHIQYLVDQALSDNNF